MISGDRRKRLLAAAAWSVLGVLVVGCQSDIEGTPVTSASPPTKPGTATAGPPAGAESLPPDESGYVFIETKSGQTRCQIDEQAVGCEAPFTNTPIQDGVRANGVNLTADGQRGMDRRQPRRHPGRHHRLPHVQRGRLDDRGHQRRHPIHQPAHRARHVRQHREGRNLLGRRAP